MTEPAKEMKGAKHEMDKAGKDVKTVNGTGDATSNSAGTIQSAHITVYEGSYSISEIGAASGATLQQYDNRVFAHESAHVGGDHVRSDDEIKALFKGSY